MRILFLMVMLPLICICQGTIQPSASSITNGSVFIDLILNEGFDSWIDKTTQTYKLGTLQPIYSKIENKSDSLVIYNFVTANGDSKNDVFEIKNLDKIGEYQLTIFDRHGNEKLNTNNYNNDWNAQNLEIGTYFFVLKYNKTEIKNYIIVTK